MLNFNPSGKQTILSIDGGGMRGVIPLTMLVWLEEQTGQPAYKLFDMAAGTSTGAIIATGLGLGFSAKEILEIAYRDKLPNAFGKIDLGAILRFIFINRTRFAYPLEPFVEALKPLVGDKRVRDVTELIVLFTCKDLRTNNTYYIVSEGPGAAAFGDWPLTGAVAASGAAPIYFPPVLGNLFDGGAVIYGNPCFAAAVEAVEYIGFDPANTLHVSLGTGHVDVGLADGAGANLGFFGWNNAIIIGSVLEAAVQQSTITQTIYGARGMDFRRYNPHLTGTIVRDVFGVNPGDIDPTTLTLDTTDPQAIALMEKIGAGYAGVLDWNDPAQNMPWLTPGGQPKPRIEPSDFTGSIFV